MEMKNSIQIYEQAVISLLHRMNISSINFDETLDKICKILSEIWIILLINIVIALILYTPDISVIVFLDIYYIKFRLFGE